jgi:hypothetical protein
MELLQPLMRLVSPGHVLTIVLYNFDVIFGVLTLQTVVNFAVKLSINIGASSL